MSHALSSKSTGRVIEGLGGKAEDAAMFYVGKEKPWHKLGTSVLTAPTSSEAIVLAGLDYEVKLDKVYDADAQEIKGYRRTYRSDNGNSLGIVGMRYTVVQNSEAFAIMDSIKTADGGQGVTFDTAGALYSGEVVWINARLPEDLVIGGDKIEPYFLLKSTHDGTGSITLKRTPIRTVCQNTLNAAIGSKRDKQDLRMQKIKHTRNYDARVREAVRAMQLTSEYYKEFKELGDKLVSMKFSEKSFTELMDQLYPMPEGDSKRGASIAERERMKMLDAYNAEDLDNIRDTAWGAFNAIADYADHSRETRGDNQEANAFIRTFENTAMKDRALELILAK
jgi:phage/plasmid-like protein (TIGR03299 family)